MVSTAASAVSSSPVLSEAVLDTIKTWIAYIGVLATAVIVAFGGIRKALKDLKGEPGKDGKMNPGGAAAHPGVQSIVGGTIMETTTLLMWSESNKQVAESAEHVKECIKANSKMLGDLPDKIEAAMDSVVNAINYNTEAQRSVCRDLSELRHQVERLRDKME